jgi:hypothetical protein
MRLLLIILGCLAGCHTEKKPSPNEGFKVENIYGEFSYSPAFEAPSPSPEEASLIHSILKGKLRYLAKGGQVYVFESEDQKWVVKFMKYHLERPPLISLLKGALLNFHSFDETIEIRKKRRLSLFEGNLLAKAHYPEASGLLYLHLNPTSLSWGFTTLVDKEGSEHLVNLDAIPFIIQRKATPFAEEIAALAAAGDKEKISSHCSALLAFINRLHDLGFVDKDYGVYKNFAFCEETIIHLDMGKLEKFPAPLDPDSRKEELSQINRRLAMWLQELQGT